MKIIVDMAISIEHPNKEPVPNNHELENVRSQIENLLRRADIPEINGCRITVYDVGIFTGWE